MHEKRDSQHSSHHQETITHLEGEGEGEGERERGEGDGESERESKGMI